MTVRFDLADHVARVTIDRPEVLNAVDSRTESELEPNRNLNALYIPRFQVPRPAAAIAAPMYSGRPPIVTSAAQPLAMSSTAPTTQKIATLNRASRERATAARSNA